MKTFESTYRMDTDVATTRFQDKVYEADSKKAYKFRRRNYLTTSFIQPAASQQLYGQYQLSFNQPQQQCCVPQQCQPCMPMMPMMMPFPCYQPQQESDCKCEEVEQFEEEIHFLRARVAELLSREPEIKVVKEVVQDTTKLNELDLENQRLKYQLTNEQGKVRSKDEDIMNLRARLQKMENDGAGNVNDLKIRLRDLESTTIQLKSELDRAMYMLKQKEQELNEWQMRYEEVTTTQTETTETITKLTGDVEMWKNKFRKLNNDYHTQQEEFMNLQVQYEAYKNGQIKEVKEVKVERKAYGGGGGITSSNNRMVVESSGVQRSSGYDKTAGGGLDGNSFQSKTYELQSGLQIEEPRLVGVQQRSGIQQVSGYSGTKFGDLQSGSAQRDEVIKVSEYNSGSAQRGSVQRGSVQRVSVIENTNDSLYRTREGVPSRIYPS